jgi:hypothetical protein
MHQLERFKVVGSPGEGSIGREINMENTEDKKLYYRAIMSVMPKDEPFGLEPPRLMAFINAIRQRGKTYGWDARQISSRFRWTMQTPTPTVTTC